MDFDENTLARVIERTGGDDAPRPEHQQRLRRQALEAFDRAQAESARPSLLSRSLTGWRWIMRSPLSRAAAVAIFVIAIGGVVLLFHSSGATPALADFLDPIIDAKTVKFKMTTEGDGQQTITAEIMVRADSRMRIEGEFSNRVKTVMILGSRERTNAHAGPLAEIGDDLHPPQRAQGESPQCLSARLAFATGRIPGQGGVPTGVSRRKGHRRTACGRISHQRPWHDAQRLGQSDDRPAPPHGSDCRGVPANESDHPDRLRVRHGPGRVTVQLRTTGRLQDADYYDGCLTGRGKRPSGDISAL